MTESQDAVKIESDIGEIIDPQCCAENPVRVTFQDITSASYLIKTGIEYTPCTVNKTGNIFELKKIFYMKFLLKYSIEI